MEDSDFVVMNFDLSVNTMSSIFVILTVTQLIYNVSILNIRES